MRIHKAPLMAAVVAVTMGATACSENSSHLTAPEETASFQVGNIQVTADQLIAALNNINVEIGELNALNDLITIGDITIGDINVQLVRVGDVLSNNTVVAFNNALNNNRIEILTLRNVLNNNNILNNFIIEVLRDANININRVVAIDVLSNGDIIVFTR